VTSLQDANAVGKFKRGGVPVFGDEQATRDAGSKKINRCLGHGVSCFAGSDNQDAIEVSKVVVLSSNAQVFALEFQVTDDGLVWIDSLKRSRHDPGDSRAGGMRF
jgi:hypothetical protein